jgi:hypothetical protein
MATNENYLAIFTGSKTSARRAAWDALSDQERTARQGQGMAAWYAWSEAHRDAIVDQGGPLGKTKRVSPDGVADAVNALAVYMVVRAASHEEAARMFEGHPHFAIFPGDGVDVMPLLPVPGA